MQLQIILVALLILSTIFSTGCLKTRDDVKNTEMAVAMNRQVTDLQKINAESSSRLDEIDSSIRNLNGRLEEMEHRSKSERDQKKLLQDESEKAAVGQKEQFELLKDSVLKLETEIQALKEEIVDLKSNRSLAGNKKEEAGKGRPTEKTTDKAPSAFQKGIEEFNGKNWQSAILSFDKYRQTSPKGANVAEATYKTGVCFQELGMKDEARVFYQETLTKFPKSEMAKKAQYRLKSLK